MPTMVLSLDGTMDSPQKPFPTHPQHVMRYIGNGDDEKLIAQNLNEGWSIHEYKDNNGNPIIAYYDQGLGSPTVTFEQGSLKFDWPKRVANLFQRIQNNYIDTADTLHQASQAILGWGILDNAACAMEFIASKYDHNNKDNNRIYLFGFSRGAYTLRLLIDVLRLIGLIDTTKEAYRKYYVGTYGKQALRHAISDGISLCSRCVDDDRANEILNFKNKYCMDANKLITFLGEWEPVKGIILESLPKASTMGNIVSAVRTANAINDRRSGFLPVATIADEGTDIKVRYFAGVHADSGGGYADKDLANAPLRWILLHAKTFGLSINEAALMLDNPIYPSMGLDKFALAHNSMLDTVPFTKNKLIWREVDGKLPHGRPIDLSDPNVELDETAIARLGQQAPKIKEDKTKPFQTPPALCIATKLYLPSNLLSALYRTPGRYPETTTILESKEAKAKLQKKGWINPTAK